MPQALIAKVRGKRSVGRPRTRRLHWRFWMESLRALFNQAKCWRCWWIV